MHLNYPGRKFSFQRGSAFCRQSESGYQRPNLRSSATPARSLGFKGPELLRAVEEKQLAIAEVPTGMVEGDAPILALTAQPFISTNAFEQRLLTNWPSRAYAKELRSSTR